MRIMATHRESLLKVFIANGYNILVEGLRAEAYLQLKGTRSPLSRVPPFRDRLPEPLFRNNVLYLDHAGRPPPCATSLIHPVPEAYAQTYTAIRTLRRAYFRKLPNEQTTSGTAWDVMHEKHTDAIRISFGYGRYGRFSGICYGSRRI